MRRCPYLVAGLDRAGFAGGRFAVRETASSDCWLRQRRRDAAHVSRQARITSMTRLVFFRVAHPDNRGLKPLVVGKKGEHLLVLGDAPIQKVLVLLFGCVVGPTCLGHFSRALAALADSQALFIFDPSAGSLPLRCRGLLGSSGRRSWRRFGARLWFSGIRVVLLFGIGVSSGGNLLPWLRL